MDDLARLVGERLRAARRERGLSLGALAEAARSRSPTSRARSSTVTESI